VGELSQSVDCLIHLDVRSIPATARDSTLLGVLTARRTEAFLDRAADREARADAERPYARARLREPPRASPEWVDRTLEAAVVDDVSHRVHGAADRETLVSEAVALLEAHDVDRLPIAQNGRVEGVPFEEGIPWALEENHPGLCPYA
jgi:CBS domain-containing protein